MGHKKSCIAKQISNLASLHQKKASSFFAVIKLKVVCYGQLFKICKLVTRMQFILCRGAYND